jgi:sarcosine oxidase subunit gamma
MAEAPMPVDLTQVDVRVEDPSSLPFQPPAPNATTTWGDRDVLWLGPDEWLVVGTSGREAAIVAEFEASLVGHRSIVDVSAARIAFDLEDALDLLATGCPIDLDPSRWTPGMCAQTLFGHAQVLLHQRDRRTTRVFVRPSFTGYLLARLGTALHRRALRQPFDQ